MIDRLPPQSIESEMAVLGACLISSDAVARVMEQAEPESFYLEAHRKIYAAIRSLRLLDNPQPADVLTVPEELRRLGQLDQCGGLAYINRLAEEVPTAAHAEYYLRTVLDKWTLRRYIVSAAEVTEMAFNESLAVEDVAARAEMSILAARPLLDACDFVPQQETVDWAYDNLCDGKRETGVETGLGELDWMTNGWQTTDLIVPAGRPGIGKTAALLHFVRAAAKTGVPCAVFSLEMSKEQLALRQLAHFSRVDMGNLRRKWELSDAQLVAVSRASAELRTWPVSVNDRGELTVDRIRALARRWRRQHPGKALILVDYIQRIPYPPGITSENQAVEINTKALKSMAKELAVPVIALSQLNRANEQRSDKRPMLSDLRGSGGIEQEADLVVFLHRPDYYKHESTSAKDQPWPQQCEWIVSKHRNGPLGTINCWFDGRYGDFTDNENRHGEAPPERSPYAG